MWEHEIDPDNIPTTPWRNYRLYSQDGAPLVGYYSLDNGEFAYGESSPRSKTFGPEWIREEILAFNDTTFGPVTLRALQTPGSNPPLDALRHAVTGRIMTGRATPIEAIED